MVEIPIYDYQCPACGFECEVRHKITESGNPPCPACKKMAKMKKVIKGCPAMRMATGGTRANGITTRPTRPAWVRSMGKER